MEMSGAIGCFALDFCPALYHSRSLDDSSPTHYQTDLFQAIQGIHILQLPQPLKQIPSMSFKILVEIYCIQ